ncbi:MAG: hypothetical protein V3V85_03370 [Candidatus Thorarchaeota archaeon]
MSKIWAAEYCFFVCEGGFEIISLHRTRRGARKAKRDHKEETLTMPWGKEKPQWGQHWRVRPIEIDPDSTGDTAK